MENIDINLEKAKLICCDKIKLDKEHKVDSFTSINVAGYFRHLNLDKKKILTVGKSSDEVFNAAFYGANDITLIENNTYILYYYYLKLAAMYTLTYREFEWFFYKYVFNHHPNNKMFSKKLFKKIKPVLKEINVNAYNFFNELFNEFDYRLIRDNLFNDSGYHRKAQHGFDIYLRNEDTYNKTKRSMININFNYLNENIFTSKIDGKYDVINLSSLCVNNSLYKMNNLYKRLDEDNLDNNGLMVLGYLWNINMYTEDYLNVWKKIYQDSNANKILNKYVTDVFYINGYRDYLWEENNLEERVLIYKKNKDHI